jgi:hypothetical protein
MVNRRGVSLFVAGAAIAFSLLWPAVAWADTCKERADAIAARQVPAGQRDPDCKRAGVMLATLTVTAASAAVSIAAVSLGLGLGLGGFGATAAGSPSLASAGAASSPPGEMPSAGPKVSVASRPEPPPVIAASPPPPTVDSSPLAEATAWAGMALTSILRGPQAFSVLERAGLAERMPGGEGHRLRAGVEAVGLQADPSSGVGGVAYFVRADGTLDPNIAVAMIEGGPSAQSAPVEMPGPSLPGVLSPEIRQALVELLNPAKLMGMKFDDIERFREGYAEAKAIENPVQAEQTQDYVVYTFSTAFGLSPEAARALLELPQAKWNVVATMIASLG